jgi:hypothetical protein
VRKIEGRTDADGNALHEGQLVNVAGIGLAEVGGRDEIVGGVLVRPKGKDGFVSVADMGRVTGLKIPDYVDLAKAHDELPELLQPGVQSLWDQAVTYVWGFQDGAKEEADSGEAWAFGLKYWEHSLEYVTQKIHCRNNIPGAFKRWRETGEIKA